MELSSLIIITRFMHFVIRGCAYFNPCQTQMIEFAFEELLANTAFCSRIIVQKSNVLLCIVGKLQQNVNNEKWYIL